MEKISDSMINTLLAFDAYEYGAMTGHVIKAWMHQLASEVKESRAQLAAEASAVEAIGKVEAWICAALKSERESWGKNSSHTERSIGYQSGLEIVRNQIIKCKETAALVQAEGKEAGK